MSRPDYCLSVILRTELDTPYLPVLIVEALKMEILYFYETLVSASQHLHHHDIPKFYETYFIKLKSHFKDVSKSGVTSETDGDVISHVLRLMSSRGVSFW